MELYKELNLFYETTQIPMEYYENDTLIYQIPSGTFQPGILKHLCDYLLKSDHSVCYGLSDNFLACGIVRNDSEHSYLLIGPVPLFTITEEAARELLLKVELSDDLVNPFLRWIHAVSSYDAPKFKGILNYLDFLVNRKSERVIYLPKIQKKTGTGKEKNYIEHVGHIEEATYEAKTLSYIESGNIIELQKIVYEILHADFFITELPLDSLRYMKNILIGTNSLACRAAIKGGLGTQTALSVSDNFLVTIERCHSFDEFCMCFSQMLISYVTYVHNCQIPENCSLPTQKIIKLVQENLYEKITPAIIAEILHMDVSYLCREFKKSTQKTITAYIQEQKITEAKRLLKATELTLSQISFQLGFSSQNYFQQVFKKVTGITPKQYAAE